MKLLLNFRLNGLMMLLEKPTELGFFKRFLLIILLLFIVAWQEIHVQGYYDQRSAASKQKRERFLDRHLAKTKVSRIVSQGDSRSDKTNERFLSFQYH